MFSSAEREKLLRNSSSHIRLYSNLKNSDVKWQKIGRFCPLIVGFFLTEQTPAAAWHGVATFKVELSRCFPFEFLRIDFLHVGLFTFPYAIC